MCDEKHRGVLIGCGFFAVNHMHAWSEIPGVTIVAVCDRDEAKARHFSEQFSCQAFTDAKVMLESMKPDFVDIATTVSSHHALVTLAAKHARLVICQKPFAETLQDAAEMVRACEATGAKLVVHENFRWQKPYRRMRQLLDEGRIGPTQFLRLSFRHAFDIYAGQPYLASIDDLALTDVGLHLFDLARFLMGDIERVTCETQTLNPRVAGQDAFQALLRFHSGAVGSVECSFYSRMEPDPFPQTLAQLEGTQGTIELLAGYELRITSTQGVTNENCEPSVPDWGQRPWHLVQESVRAFQTHVVAVLNGTAEAAPSGAHNLETLAVVIAATTSSRTHQTQTIKRTLEQAA